MEESATSLTIRVRILEQHNNQLSRQLEDERQARAVVAERWRLEKIKSARALSQIASLTEQLKKVQQSLEAAQMSIASGINCFQAANYNVNNAQEQLEGAVASQLQLEHFPPVPQNSRLQIVLPTHGETPPKLQARVNPMVQGVQIRKPSIHLYRLSSSVLLANNDNAASSSATAATAVTPSQQAAIPLVSMDNELSIQGTASNTISSDVGGETPEIDDEYVPGSGQSQRRRSSRLRRT